jgi:hypothetical protein
MRRHCRIHGDSSSSGIISGETAEEVQGNNAGVNVHVHVTSSEHKTKQEPEDS